MRNKGNTRIGKILEVAKKLPAFTMDNLASIETDRKYLKILLFRHIKSGNVIHLKRGMYVARDYLDGVERSGRTSVYAEFLAGVLRKSSYLSLEHVLYRHGIITELPATVTLVTRKKTASFITPFGTYQYHSIKPTLFTGFTSKRDGDYLIFRASLVKALFDFLYFRKDHLTSEEIIKELRLNLEMFSESDKMELARYVRLEGSTRMNNIIKTLWKN
ncbi:MAG: hypothetical protein NTZ38_01740 [Candidatus Taylorbacteria bacterium]|nr:hypothetical protein [Candidatus Taylorbacteria bacterium]